MRKRRALLVMGLGFCSAISTVDVASTLRIRIIGQHAGRVDGFHYSPSFAQTGFTNENTLDAWLTNPQAVIPGAIMAYRQSKPETRAAIITYLKGLN
jgi:cytochrome c